jgi:hypothetical protein
MEIEKDMKVRFREKNQDEKPWRYALTISQNGVILSSCTDATKAQTFSAEVVENVSKLKANKVTGVYKDTEVEFF